VAGQQNHKPIDHGTLLTNFTYYAGDPWCGVVPGGSYGTTVGLFGRESHTCYSGWDNYKQVNGLGCDPGTVVKAGDGVNYVCQ